jgi:hypothetical protein
MCVSPITPVSLHYVKMITAPQCPSLLPQCKPTNPFLVGLARHTCGTVLGLCMLLLPPTPYIAVFLDMGYWKFGIHIFTLQYTKKYTEKFGSGTIVSL